MTGEPHSIRRALRLVSKKEGLVPPFARELAARGVALVSTGGTARTRRSRAPGDEVAQVTGFPGCRRAGRPAPGDHGGPLARRDQDHLRRALAAHGIGEIDLLVVNLYPFEATVASGAGATSASRISISAARR